MPPIASTAAREAGPGSELLTVRGVSRRFGMLRALDGVSFGVGRGEILGLIGPNGSGKTTLFECVAGLLHADAGTVMHDGALVAPDRRKAFLFHLPDGIRPWPEQTVKWMLSFVGSMFGSETPAISRLVDALHLEHLLGARLGALSKGEHKRAMLASALLTPHPLLLLDEPFDGLDLRQTQDAMALLTEQARGGRTLFLSIHQLGDAARICDRLVLLNGGKVVAEGTLPELAALANTTSMALDEIFLALT